MTNNLLAMLEHSVSRFGDRPALYDLTPDGSHNVLTYRELWTLVRRAAAGYNEYGVRAGDRVGLAAYSRSWWPITDFAVMSLGASLVPIYPTLPPNQMAFIIRHSGMRGIAVQDAAQLRKLLDIDPAEIPELQFVVLLDRQEFSENLVEQANSRYAVAWHDDWLGRQDVWTEAEWSARWANLGRDTMATIVFTSGTTGTPKGVVLTHGNLLANLDGIKHVVRVLPTDRSLSYLPLSHIFERTCGQFVLLEAGAAIVYSRGFQHIMEDFQRMPPTVFTTVPRLLEKVVEGVRATVANGPRLRQRIFAWAMDVGTRTRVDQTAAPGIQLKLADGLVFRRIHHVFGGQLRAIIVGGAPMPLYVGRFFTAAGVNVTEGYGLTETAPVISANRPEAPRLGTAGVVLPNVQVKIADDGEVLVKGPSVMKEYFRNPEATREAFTEDGWFRTGDIGLLTETGELKITDRKKNLIVLSTGKKVTPAPIEGDILKDPSLDQVVLIGHARKFVSAIVVPNPEVVRAWYAAKGRALPPEAAWNSDQELKAHFLQIVQQQTQHYAPFEQPKKIVIAREPFSVDNELLTPTLKPKVKQILQAYGDDIDQLYAETEAAAGVQG